MNAPIPQNEAARLQALRDYAILDTLDEQAFNDIATLASFICETPIALISLVDEQRQWFKARVGTESTQTPREHALCAHAILQPQEVMVVNDAQSDPRFVDNPLVTGDPNIRFYAGAPLVTPRGDALGTLCVIDHKPRQLPAANLEALRALSRQVVAQLELRRAIAELDRRTFELRDYQSQLEDAKRRLEAANASLKVQTVTDSLTEVNNRRAFDDALHRELARGVRENKPVSLLLMDIDKFKAYNDKFGHLAGDEALRQVAQILAAHARPFDFVARYGGEEFAVVLAHTGVEEAVVVAERLRLAIQNASWANRGITISIGASTTGPEMDETALIAEADSALYRVKERGGNQVAHASHAA